MDENGREYLFQAVDECYGGPLSERAYPRVLEGVAGVLEELAESEVATAEMLGVSLELLERVREVLKTRRGQEFGSGWEKRYGAWFAAKELTRYLEGKSWGGNCRDDVLEKAHEGGAALDPEFLIEYLKRDDVDVELLCMVGLAGVRSDSTFPAMFRSVEEPAVVVSDALRRGSRVGEVVAGLAGGWEEDAKSLAEVVEAIVRR